MAKKKSGSKKSTTQVAVDEFRKKFELLDDRRKKHTAQAIERRRQDVWDMMCQEVPQTEMADLLGVARSTIALDVKYWRELVHERVNKIKEDPNWTNTELGMTIQKLDSVIAAGFTEYAGAKSGGEKAKFLDIITKTLSTKTRLLQEAGYLPKAGIEIRARVEREPTFEERFGSNNPLKSLDNANSRHRLLSLAEKIIRLSETESTTIDIEGHVVGGGDAPPTNDSTSLVPLDG